MATMIDGMTLETIGRLRAIGGPDPILHATRSARANGSRGAYGRHAVAWLRDAMRQARADGATYAAIARQLRCAPATVKRWTE